MFIKQYLFFIFIFFSFSNIFGQSKITGKIIDTNNSTPIAFVQITNINSKVIMQSSLNGSFELMESGTYIFKKEGYLEKTVIIENDKYHIIQLNLNPSQLNEVIINSNHIAKKLKNATASINIISSQDIERSNNININTVLNKTPGVFMQSGALNTNRITIRGIGSRNLFGTSKIRAYFKDIPLTNGSGETNIEDFELGTISRLEIIKGAVSSVYGAGLGGTINLIPEQGFFSNQQINNQLTIGSFGLIKNLSSLNLSSEKSSLKAVYSSTQSDGYRDNNEYKRQTFTLNSSHFIGDKDELSFLASFVDLKAFIPSSLNETNYLNNPKSAAFTWDQAKGFEESERGVFGLSWKHDYSTKFKQSTSIFTSFRKGYEPRPFNILSEKTIAFGIRSRLIGQTKMFNKPLNWTLGGELFKDTYKYTTYENLYQDFPPETGSVKGNRLSDFKEKRNYYNAFFETNYNISSKTILSIGLNLNETSYTLKDRFPVSESNPDQSGDFKFKTILSPKFGVSHELVKNINAFSSLSHGFSPISLEETLLPDGQINTSLKPETGWNFEFGTRGSIIQNKLQFNVSIYRLNIKNLLVSRRIEQDQYIGINAGKTQHDGIEMGLDYQLISNKSFHVSTVVNYSINDYKFKTFIDESNDYSGNDLTGVPSQIFNGIIDFYSSIGIYGNINFQHVGEMPITDRNNLYSDSYSLTNLKIGFKRNLFSRLNYNLFLGLNNIFDKHYASQILINASGFGGNAPRYYYPGNPVNYYTGINLDYTF
ncbi:TonB-dependent receptor domain-containing protein [Seonamhaeicola maritimus]|uniref:TonB-dependent receptor domain-containing protein n=1 Tax=Seonamhaeicola maritimus TaxID=2591822 RepID=UPI0024946EBE|nr:TonB-dependent receptor [Seonamhaeicola maritimus]